MGFSLLLFHLLSGHGKQSICATEISSVVKRIFFCRREKGQKQEASQSQKFMCGLAWGKLRERVKQKGMMKEKNKWNLSNNTGQKGEGGKKREKEPFSDCEKISVTWSVCWRQEKRNFSWRLSEALDKVRIGTLALRGKMFHQACEWSFHSGKVITGGEAAYSAPVPQLQRCKNGRDEEGRKVGRERKGDLSRTRAKGYYTSSSALFLLSMPLPYYLRAAAFLKKEHLKKEQHNSSVCGDTLDLTQQGMTWARLGKENSKKMPTELFSGPHHIDIWGPGLIHC